MNRSSKVVCIEFGTVSEYHLNVRVNTRMTIQKIADVCRNLSKDYSASKYRSNGIEITWEDGNIKGVRRYQYGKV